MFLTVCKSAEENCYHTVFGCFKSDIKKQLNIMLKKDKTTVN